MKFDSIDEIWTYLQTVRSRYEATIADVTDECAAQTAETDSWTIAMIAEHLNIVEGGMLRIISKLVKDAPESDKTEYGKAFLSSEFLAVFDEKAEFVKFQAPEMVVPSGNQLLSDTKVLRTEIRKNLAELVETLKTKALTDRKFPHPRFGPINAHDWFLLIGIHESRHTDQIERIKKSLG